MSVVAELDASLQALLDLKPPGVTKSRIASITTLCVENVKSESVLVQKIYTHFKRTPATHKLGVLYVVDSVTRQWIDKATAAGQELAGTTAADGTYAAGVRRVTELLPLLMNDLSQSVPDDQKEKTLKLVQIWERGGIFPTQTLLDFKAKLNARPEKVPIKTTTTSAFAEALTSSSVAGQESTLAGGKPEQVAPIVSTQYQNAPIHQQDSLQGAHTLNSSEQHHADGNHPNQYPTGAVPVPPAASITAEQASALAAVIPSHVAANPEALTQHLQLLQQLVQMGVPTEQWNIVATALEEQKAAQRATQRGGGEHRARSRSPSRRRDSPVYGNYENGRPHRQRSPYSPSQRAGNISNDQPKWLDFDATIPDGAIKVLSRTLFVGGATCSEDELRSIFTRFGKVQTCISNSAKRHAFVKMQSRADAVRAKEGMENGHDPDVLSRVRSTRWGVGFGPRDCSNYQTGISVIPIDRLTDADRKWIVTATFGGTGGKPVQSGMVMEEPDIEIGAGVSSKAISRRLGGYFGSGRQPDRSPYDDGQGPVPTSLPNKLHATPPQQYDPNGFGVRPTARGSNFQFSGMSAMQTGSGSGMPQQY